MLPRFSTALALLLVMLGMFWLGDACCDNVTDSDPVSTAEFLRSNVDSSDKEHDDKVLLEHAVEAGTIAGARPLELLSHDATARIRHRPQQHTVRGPPSLSA